jgi:microcystin-dependent protein
MATVTPGYSWTSGEVVTPAKMNSAAAPTVAVADGEVTVAKLAAAVQQLLVPAGAVQAFAMNSAPTGWLAADGSNVNRTTYSALFSAIGTTYGVGDGSTTFALPDLRGIFVRGSGSQTISGTAYSGTFSQKLADALKTHTHTFSATSGGESLQHGHTVNSIITTGLGGSNANITQGGGAYRLDNVTTTFNGSGHTHSVNGTTDNPSTGTSAETRPANIALLYCIKF